MSCYVIYYQGRTKMLRPVHSEAEYCGLRDSGQQTSNLAKAREGDAVAKSHLLQMNYSCFPGPEGGVLKGCSTPSNSVGMDVDFDRKDPDYQARMAAIPQQILARKEELGLLMLERSASKGYHLVFKRHEDKSQIENLKWASQLLNVAFDQGAKDITRVFFTTSAKPEDLLFLDPQLFDNAAASGASASVVDESKQEQPAENASGQDPEPDLDESDLTYYGIPYEEFPKAYIHLFCDDKAPTFGDRNVKTFEMAVTFMPICNYSQKLLEKMIPRYADFPEEEWHNTIANALKEPHKGMSYRLRQVLKHINEKSMIERTGGSQLKPPPLPRRLPPLLGLLTSKVPEYYKPTVCQGIWPALGAHFHGVKFRYMNNVDQEPTFMSVCIAPMSSGKSCVNKPIDYIMADILARDSENRRRDDEWKEANKTKAANKGKDLRPKDIVIQWITSDITRAALSQRILDAERAGDRFIYSRYDEIEQLLQVCNAGKSNSIAQIIRLALDVAMYGQDRVGTESVCGTAHLRWNWNASTTPLRGQKFMNSWVSDGTLSRLMISTIIRDPGDTSMPVYGIYDDKFAAELQPYIDRINAASGLIILPEALALAKRLDKLVKEEATDCESDAYLELSHRSCLFGFLQAMVLYVAQGMVWTREIENFAIWSVKYDLWCKMHFFGEELQGGINEEKKLDNKGPVNLYLLLPPEFSIRDYRNIRAQNGLKGNGEGTLRQWKARKKIAWDDVVGNYRKLK